MEGRVTEVHRTNFTIKTSEREYTATVRGAFHIEGDFPKVGDFVVFEVLNDEQAVITAVLPRSSVIKRRRDDGEEQVLVANVNLMFIVMGLDGDYNLKRLQRYLLLATQSDIPAVVVLNKSDISDEVEERVAAAEGVAGAAPVVAVSATTGAAMSELASYITSDTTAVLLGSSGAGKSTITNWLLQDEQQDTQGIRADDSRGRHTTTSRQLFALPQGGYLIDTPGMRELGIVDGEADDERILFDKITTLSEQCRFRNCDHDKSAGCAVLAALESGELSEAEWQNYQKLSREREWQESKESSNAARHYQQNEKRQQQRYEKMRRDRLSGR